MFQLSFRKLRLAAAPFALAGFMVATPIAASAQSASLAQTISGGTGAISRTTVVTNDFVQPLIPPCTSENPYTVHTVSTQRVHIGWTTIANKFRAAGTFRDSTENSNQYWTGTPTVAGDPQYHGSFADDRQWTTEGSFTLDQGGALVAADKVVYYRLDLNLVSPATTTSPALNARQILVWRNVAGFDINTSAPTEVGTTCNGTKPVPTATSSTVHSMAERKRL
jgi:hypothetical protein